MANYRLKAHESFILREGWITKALFAIHDNPKLFSVNSGADELGVGTNMAKAIRYWLRVSGLTEEYTNKGVFLSSLGQIVYEKDPFIEDTFTLWLIHCNICLSFSQATSWNVFFNDLEVTSFSKQELDSIMMELLLERTGELTLPERSVKDDCSAILSMYSDKNTDNTDPEEKRISPFVSLGLISFSASNYIKKSPVDVPSEIVLYLISDVLQNEGSILIGDIVEKRDLPGKILNMNRVDINTHLDDLEHNGYITVNRTAGLDIVYPNKSITKLDLVANHYEEA